MNENSQNNIKAIVSKACRIDLSSAETHRMSALSNLKNAIENLDDDEIHAPRLQRMAVLLNDAESSTPDRKLFLLTHTVIPVLENMLETQ